MCVGGLPSFFSGHHLVLRAWREPTSPWNTAPRWCPGMPARKWRTTSVTGRNSRPGGSCGSTWPRLRRFDTLWLSYSNLGVCPSHHCRVNCMCTCSMLYKSYELNCATFREPYQVPCSKYSFKEDPYLWTVHGPPLLLVPSNKQQTVNIKHKV